MENTDPEWILPLKIVGDQGKKELMKVIADSYTK